jgi:hypothetical protein
VVLRVPEPNKGGALECIGSEMKKGKTERSIGPTRGSGKALFSSRKTGLAFCRACLLKESVTGRNRLHI